MAEWTKALIPDDKDQIASDLLSILQKIPMQVIGEFHLIAPLLSCGEADDVLSGQLHFDDGENPLRRFESARHSGCAVGRR